MSDLAELLVLADATARAAGVLLLEGSRRTDIVVDTKSTGTDMVTEIDRAAELLIIERILASRPDDGLLGEEGASKDGTSGVRWVIDPIDGTTNFLYGFPAFCVSIGAEVDGERAVAAVHDPLRDETFTATRGGGAFCNGVPIHTSTASDLAHSLIGTGFAYAADRRSWQAAAVAHAISRVRDIRRAGSAALDLCWVACGRLDGTFERGLMPWDWAAGSLIVEEAGGRVALDHSDHPTWVLTCSAAPGIADALFALARDAEAAAGPIPT